MKQPAVAVAVILTLLTGLAAIIIGIASFIANTRMFGVGVAAVLMIYGLVLIAMAVLTARGQGWALGIIVASSLLHTFVVGEFLLTDDRAQFVGSLIVAPFVLATLVASVLAAGRRDLDKL